MIRALMSAASRRPELLNPNSRKFLDAMLVHSIRNLVAMAIYFLLWFGVSFREELGSWLWKEDSARIPASSADDAAETEERVSMLPV
jgi:hypothetical protein